MLQEESDDGFVTSKRGAVKGPTVTFVALK
jgi:hypothetical protein